MDIDLSRYPVLVAASLARREGDLIARDLLLDLAEAVYGEMRRPSQELLKCRAVTVLMHAEIYLEDRLLYQLYPPPNKLAVLVESEASQ